MSTFLAIFIGKWRGEEQNREAGEWPKKSWEEGETGGKSREEGEKETQPFREEGEIGSKK